MSSNPTLVKLVENVLKRSGLLDIRTTIISDIEEEIAGAYDSIDDEEDDAMTPSYGGIVYSSYYYLTESGFEYRVDKKLTDAQKEFTNKIVEDRELTISVERTDSFSQKWGFELHIPTVPNKLDSDRFVVSVEMKVSLFHPNRYEIKAIDESELDENDIEKIFLLYTLSA